MTAQPSSRYSPPPHRSVRRLDPGVHRSSAHRTSPRRDPHRVVTFEAAVRLGVNLVLGIGAISTLIKLVPYNLTQQEKLRELSSEVAEIEGRVDRLQAEFDHNFDPNQTMNVMREQSARLNPNQRQIIWMHPTASTAERIPHDADQSQQAFSRQEGLGIRRQTKTQNQGLEASKLENRQ